MPEHDRRKLGGAIRILVADDDADDRFLIKEAFEESSLANTLDFVEDGVELMDYLKSFCAGDKVLPGLILLDLNMPKKDGREALKEIKTDPQLRTIPVVVLTTSKAEEDIFRTYDLGVNSFITKPVTFEGLVEIIQSLSNYWLQIVRLSSDPDHQRAA